MNFHSPQFFMSEALRLAEKALFTTSPNPRVGCVIVQNNEIIGRGYHVKAGESHAEVIALKEAGSKSEGSDVYVTLEPCSHTGRTPPCVDALIKANVKKVIIAMQDPNPLVSGQGIQKLKEAIGLASIAVSRDTTKPTMAAVLLHIQKTNIRLVSTDGFRLAIAEIPCETKINEEVKLVVPRRALDLFPQLLTNEGEVVIAWDATTLYIDQPGLKFSTRLVNGNFPTYEKVIPQELPKKVLIDRDLLSKRLRFVGLKKDDYNKNVQLVFAYPNLKIVFQHPDEGTNQSTLPFSGEEQAFELAFNIDYLTEILDRLTGEDVVYQFKDEIGQGIFTSPSIEGFVFRYILMPVRFANPTPA